VNTAEAPETNFFLQSQEKDIFKLPLLNPKIVEKNKSTEKIR